MDQHTTRACRIELPPGGSVEGDLTVPEMAVGLVVFAHGSGSSRHSSRNRGVARALNQRGLATLLMDLLTSDEEERDQFTREHRFDIPLLSQRVAHTIDWVSRQDEPVASLPLGCFGASTGAAAALVAAAMRPDQVGAVVSRGGRPDLADEALELVRAPTLLLVGGADPQVLELNEQAASRLTCPTRLEVIPGATHLFEEPGTLEQVEQHAADWFLEHLGAAPPADRT